MDWAAPALLTAIAKALLAVRRALTGVSPEAIPARKKPVKVSPAAVVSTVGTWKIGWYRVWVPS